MFVLASLCLELMIVIVCNDDIVLGSLKLAKIGNTDTFRLLQALHAGYWRLTAHILSLLNRNQKSKAYNNSASRRKRKYFMLLSCRSLWLDVFLHAWVARMLLLAPVSNTARIDIDLVIQYLQSMCHVRWRDSKVCCLAIYPSEIWARNMSEGVHTGRRHAEVYLLAV